jgi:hypothetical protein
LLEEKAGIGPTNIRKFTLSRCCQKDSICHAAMEFINALITWQSRDFKFVSWEASKNAGLISTINPGLKMLSFSQ